MTSERKGNSPVRSSLVEMEAALKAGHAVESARDMQSLCAIALCMLPATSAQMAVVVFRRVAGRRRCLRDALGDGCSPPSDRSCVAHTLIVACAYPLLRAPNPSSCPPFAAPKPRPSMLRRSSVPSLHVSLPLYTQFREKIRTCRRAAETEAKRARKPNRVAERFYGSAAVNAGMLQVC